MHNDVWFRVHAVVPMALRRLRADDPPPVLNPTLGGSASERARVAVARVGWTNADQKEAFRALLDAVVHLEAEVERLHRVGQLARQGVELHNELISIGGDGLTMPHAMPWPDGTVVQVYLNLPVRDANRLISIKSVIAPCTEPGTTEVRFDGIHTEQRDLMVAFAFQQQAKERRRALGTSDSK